MNHPLDGARLKIDRAQEHLDSLKAEVRMYVDTHPYEIFKRKHPTGDEFPDVRVTSQPPIRLSAIVGDVVVNARAALDYIVWELAGVHAIPPLSPASQGDRRLFAMPLQNGPRRKNDPLDNRLNGCANRKIPTAALTMVEDIQPYNALYEPLWWLHELVNTDKHRSPLLTISVIPGFGWMDDGETTTELPVWHPDWDGELDTKGSTSLDEAMKKQGHSTVHVTFEDIAMPRKPVTRTLGDIVETVANVIPRFDQFFA